MSKILHVEPINRFKSVILTSTGNVALIDSNSEYVDVDNVLATSSAGCRAIADALNIIANKIDSKKGLK